MVILCIKDTHLLLDEQNCPVFSGTENEMNYYALTLQSLGSSCKVIPVRLFRFCEQ